MCLLTELGHIPIMRLSGVGRQNIAIPVSGFPTKNCRSHLLTSIFQSDCAWHCPSASSAAPVGKDERALLAIVEVKRTGAANAASSQLRQFPSTILSAGHRTTTPKRGLPPGAAAPPVDC